MSPKQVLPAIGVALALILGACGGSDDEGSKVSADDKAAVATTYADLVLAAYDASIKSAGTMQTAIDAFVDKPRARTLAGARKAWLTARDDYVLTEPFRFYGGPIDDPDDGPEGLINAWPMDEAYIDYVKGNAKAGIVNDTKAYPKITADVIVESNEKGGETNISSGWHAIEFLLWGQDQSKDDDLARRLRLQIDATLAKAEAFPATFETMIGAAGGSPESEALEGVISDLEEQGQTMAEAAKELDVKVGFGV